jgi:hypothetical protein
MTLVFALFFALACAILFSIGTYACFVGTLKNDENMIAGGVVTLALATLNGFAFLWIVS